MILTVVRTLIAISWLVFFSADAFARAKTDLIFLKNGDRVTGEIKSLLRGKLELKTDNMGTVNIEWTAILEVVSSTGHTVELVNGTRFYGPLEKSENQEMVSIGTSEGAVGVNSLDVIAMYPVEAGFWDRLDLTAELGFSWDKASKVGRGNLGIDATWRDPGFITRGSFSTEVTTQESRDDTSRTVLTFNHMRFTRSKRFRSFFGSMEHNDELALDLRTLVGGGLGWVPLRSQKSILGLLAGINVNHEIPLIGEATTNLEFVGNFLFDYFYYSYPERRFQVNFNVYPSITERGRIRATLDTSFRVELFRDLFWSLTGYASFDSEPNVENGEKTDYGVVSALGYKF